LSRARQGVKNAFGILIKKFRIFNSQIQQSPENINKITMTACVLHNYVRNDLSGESENSNPTPQSTYFTTFCHVGGNASDEATRVM
jgi:hypothetical protein